MKSSVAVLGSIAGLATAQFPGCAQSCVNQALSGFSGNFQQLCSDGTRLNNFNTCLSSGAACNQNDKNTINSFITSNCGANWNSAPAVAGASIPAAAPAPTNGNGNSQPSNIWSNPAAQSAYNSYTSAHPSGFNGADYSSFTAAYGPVPTGLLTGSWGGNSNGGGYSPNNNGNNWGSWGGPGGAGGPGGYNWGTGSGPWGSGPGGWSMSYGGPFGGSWGSGPWASGSPWTTGPWTSWWNGDKCPPATWSGWTSGSWSSNAPWTSWSACTAQTTAQSVYTTTNAGGQQVTGTSFGYQVAQAQQTGGFGSGNGGSNGNGGQVVSFNAAPVGQRVAGGAAALALLGAVIAA